MTTEQQLKALLMKMITTPIAERVVKSGLGIWPPEDEVQPAYDNHLQKIALTLVHKAEQGDIKAIDKIRELVGNTEWPQQIPNQ